MIVVWEYGYFLKNKYFESTRHVTIVTYLIDPLEVIFCIVVTAKYMATKYNYYFDRGLMETKNMTAFSRSGFV